MPTHKKGQDRDKYYHLAKDQGYRSRAAFKLIQINRRFDILSKARVCIDLCAAPGGWCQVASKFMPKGSIVIGVDLMPIRTIKNVKTFVCDITTAECRKLVSAELQGWKADVVLCDGAPNIGSSYSKDAYVQNELVLAALKTATMHLQAGGSFCTKIYRSVDYNALVWVFQQLFEDVQSVKPSSSRSQSSEIFLVCMKYTAPSFIDPKLLDPNFVFKDVNVMEKTVDVLHKKYDDHNKRHRSGYDDSQGILLHKKCPLQDFIRSEDPVRLLTDCDQIMGSSTDDSLRDISIPEDILEILSDLNIRNKSDFKKVLKWRQSVRELITEKSPDIEAHTPSLAKMENFKSLGSDDDLLEHHINSIDKERKAMKKQRKNSTKERNRQALGITNNVFEETSMGDMFDIENAMRLERLSGENFSEIDQMLPSDDEISSGDGPEADEQSISSEHYDDDVDTSRYSADVKKSWFSHPSFEETFSNSETFEDNDASDEDISEMPTTDKIKRSLKRKKTRDRNDRKKKRGEDNLHIEIGSDPDAEHVDENVAQYQDKIHQGFGHLSRADGGSFEIVKAGNDAGLLPRGSVDFDDLDEHDKMVNLALGTLMLNPSKKKSIIDATYNRYSWEDDAQLPDWFRDDEMRHNKPEIPVPNTLVEQVKGRFVNPAKKEIKKVVEARMRKRKRAATKLQNAKRKAMSMVDSPELSGSMKVKAVNKMMRSIQKEKGTKTYVVANRTKGASTGNIVGSKKGKFKFVDSRMKKDLRKMRQAKKKAKK